MPRIIRSLIKKPLNLLGLDLIRYQPKYQIGQYAFLTSLNIETVIDAGAHQGEFALMIKELLPNAAIISFEPLEDEFYRLQQNMRGVSNFSAFNFALGDHCGTAEIHRSEYSQSSSLIPMASLHKEAFPETARETIEVVEVRRLDDVLSEIELRPEILFKIDVQGYEDRVIAGSASVISKARALIVEVSFQELYEGQPLFDAIYLGLKGNGFAYRGNLYQLLNPKDGSILQADALFVRT
jgi:FkbM family methyltransferase